MNAVLGQYLNIDTFLHRLHPLTKLCGVFVMMILTLLTNNIYMYGIYILFLLCVLLVTHMPLSIMVKSLWSVRFIFIFIFIFNLIFMRSGTPIWQWGIIAIYPETIIATSNLVIRLLLLTSYAALLTLTTRPLDLTYAIEDSLKPLGNIAHILGMILSIALRFVPTLQEEAYKIMKAQESRGASFTEGNVVKRAKHLVSLLIPLFIISFTRAETLALAMEARGYDPNATRTRYHTLHWQKQDTLCILVLTFMLICVIIAKIYFMI